VESLWNHSPELIVGGQWTPTHERVDERVYCHRITDPQSTHGVVMEI